MLENELLGIYVIMQLLRNLQSDISSWTVSKSRVGLTNTGFTEQRLGGRFLEERSFVPFCLNEI